MSYNGSYKIGVEGLTKQASRAMHALLAKCRLLGLPVDIQLYLFDTLVVPILLYGCEVWGHQQIQCVEKLHLRFLKYVLGVKLSTCNSVVYGELGRYPLIITIKKRMISYWIRTLVGKETKLSHVMLQKLTMLQNSRSYSSKWTSCIKSILDTCGLSYIWNCETPVSVDWLKSAVTQSLNDQFLQNWRQDLESKSSCDFYSSFKLSFRIENYLMSANQKVRRSVCQFRTANNKLPKVTGRYKNIPRHERFCPACDKHEVGDEFHLLVECSNPVVVSARKKYLPKFLFSRPSVAKCASWLGDISQKDVTSLGLFLHSSLSIFK